MYNKIICINNSNINTCMTQCRLLSNSEIDDMLYTKRTVFKNRSDH